MTAAIPAPLPPPPAFRPAGPASTKATRPFCIRLTADERKSLELAAGGVPLGTYIRSRILDSRPLPSRPRYRKIEDQAALARVLAQLGRSHLAADLGQLAAAARMGALIVTPDLVDELVEACAAVKSMRHDLLRALGLKGGSQS